MQYGSQYVCERWCCRRRKSNEEENKMKSEKVKDLGKSDDGCKSEGPNLLLCLMMSVPCHTYVLDVSRDYETVVWRRYLRYGTGTVPV
jgi:hypothetical protein